MINSDESIPVKGGSSGSIKIKNKIKNETLLINLDYLQMAAERIWRIPDRIIKGDTNRNLKHSEHIADIISSLIEMHKGSALSEDELYLLLTGIYLHDIGIQLDVAVFSDILNEAENLGAKFNIDFSAKNASSYSIEEQRELRENHHFIGAAWISYANRTGRTMLGEAAKGIPPKLLSDVIEICKFHSNVPISECPINSKSDPTIRTRFLCSLLRFADELDTKRGLVSFSVIRQIRFDINKAIYRWFHSIADVSFKPTYPILISIDLNHSDYIKYCDIIYEKFIAEFQTKNQPLIDILKLNGIFITVSPESSIKEANTAPSLPIDLIEELSRELDKTDKLQILSNEVRTWLGALRYEMSDIIELGEGIAEIEAMINIGTFKQKVLIRCIARNVDKSDLIQFNNKLNINLPQDGLLISNRTIPEAVLFQAEKYRNIQVYQISDFLQQKIWRDYIIFLTSLVERSRITEFYVDLNCFKEIINESTGEVILEKNHNIDNYIDKWQKQPGKLHISLLGEFGTGKTWFCRHYANRQLKKYFDDPSNERIPLLITLRDFTKATTAQQLINDALIEQYKLPLIGSPYETFKDLNRRGKLLLILDGFDEMAQKVDYQVIVDNFWELAKLVESNSKVILTSRTEYFRLAKESEKILGGEEYGRVTLELSPPKFEVLHLEPLNNSQITELIKLRKGDLEGEVIANKILTKPNLVEMARKPILVELLLAALEELTQTNEDIEDILERPSQVYLYSTNKLILRNITSERTFTSAEDKIYFLCELAWEMIRSGKLQIHYKSISDRIKHYFNIETQSELDHWDYDLRNQTLLHRDAKGYYEFAHKSLAEYFVAFKFAAELGCLDSQFSNAYRERNGKPATIPFRPKRVADLSETFGLISLKDAKMSAIRTFLSAMVSKDAPGLLWRIIDESSGKTVEEVNFSAGNAAILLKDKRIWRPSPYDDITELLDNLLIPQESVFPPAPAEIIHVEKALQKVGIIIKNGIIKKRPLGEIYENAIQTYNLLKKGNLKEASNLADQIGAIEAKFWDLCSEVNGFAGIQSLFLGSLDDSNNYFEKYTKYGGSELWANLKIAEVFLHKASREELIGKDNSTYMAKAEEIAKDVLIKSSQYGKLEMEGRAILFLGILDRVNLRFNDSVLNCEKALDIFINNHDNKRSGMALANMGFALRMNGDYPEAILKYDKAYDIFRLANDTYRMACDQARRASAYRMLKEYDKAIRDYKESIEFFRNTDDFREAVILRELGTTYLILGRWNEAIKNYDNAISIFNKGINLNFDEVVTRKGQTHYSKGLALLMQGKWQESIQEFNESLDIFKTRNDDNYICLAYSSLGIAMRMLNLFPAAIDYLRLALGSAEKLNDDKRECLLHIQIADALLRGYKYNDSLAEYICALNIAEHIPDNILKGRINGEIGVLYRKMNDLEDAEPYLRKSLSIFTEYGDMGKISWMLEELGQVYIMQGFYLKAIEENNHALKTLSLGCKGPIHENLVNLVEGFVLQTVYRGEIKRFKAAINEIEKLGNLTLMGKILRNLGEAYRRMGKYKESIKHLEESLEISQIIKDKDQEGKTLSHLGLTYASLAHSSSGADKFSYYGIATSKINSSISIFENLGDRFLQSWALENQGYAYLLQRNWTEAIINYTRALELESKSGLIHLSLAVCYKNLNETYLFKEECEKSHESLAKDGMNEFNVACLEAVCGDKENAIDLFESGLNKGRINIELLTKEPYLDRIYDNKRFHYLLDKFKDFNDIYIIPFM